MPINHSLFGIPEMGIEFSIFWYGCLEGLLLRNSIPVVIRGGIVSFSWRWCGRYVYVLACTCVCAMYVLCMMTLVRGGHT